MVDWMYLKMLIFLLFCDGDEPDLLIVTPLFPVSNIFPDTFALADAPDTPNTPDLPDSPRSPYSIKLPFARLDVFEDVDIFSFL